MRFRTRFLLVVAAAAALISGYVELVVLWPPFSALPAVITLLFLCFVITRWWHDKR